MKLWKRLLAVGLAIGFTFSFTLIGDWIATTSFTLIGDWIGKRVEAWIATRAERTYTIHFNANGGEGEMEDLLIEKGQDGYLPKCTFTKEGFESLAWSTTPDGGSKYGYIPNLTFWLPEDVKDGDTVELYAVWTTPGFTFELQGWGFTESAYVKSYTGNAKDVIIPTFTNDHLGPSAWGCGPVHGVNSGVFKDHTEIERVVNFPGTDIYRDVFSGCTSLKEVAGDFYDIGERAFYNCSNLQGISLKSTEKIGKEAFYMCTSMKEIIIPATIEEIGKDAFYGWTKEQKIILKDVDMSMFEDGWLNGCEAEIVELASLT